MSTPAPLRFGTFELDPLSGELRKGGRRVPLQSQPAQVLCQLVSHPGQVVSRDELRRAIWADDTFVEFDTALNVAINKVRQALQDSAAAPRFIETVPRRGYRFLADVHPIDPGPASDEGAEDGGGPVDPSALPLPMPGSRFPFSRALVIAMVGVGLGVGVLALGLPRMLRPPAAEPFARPRVERVTNVGRVTGAALSPRGEYLAYALGEPGRQELWIKHLPTGSTVPLVGREEVLYWGLTFSPDGHYVYFATWRHNEVEGVLHRIPVLGGTPQRLIQGSGASVSFSPDGRRFAYVDDHSTPGQGHLVTAEADGSARRVLVTRPETHPFSEAGVPAWSPDGTLIACGASVRAGERDEQRVIAVRATDGGEQTISERGWTAIGRLVWLAGGGGLFITAKEEPFSPWRIWHVSYPSGTARLVLDDPNDYGSLTLPADGSGVLAVQRQMASGVWVWPAGRPELARRITSEIGDYPFVGGLAWTPNGRLVRRSRASGSWDLWLMNPDGTVVRQLTSDPHSESDPSVFAAGRSLVFASDRAGRRNIWRMEIDGTDPRRLTDAGDETRPQASPDGRWVVYQRMLTGGRATVWRVPAEGGAAVQLSDRHALRPVISPDGRLIGYFFMDRQKWGIDLMPVDGGAPVASFDVPPTVRSRALGWAPDGRALVYVDDADGVSNLWRMPLDGAPRRRLTDFRSDHIPAFAWSADGSWIAAVRENETSDVVRVTFAP